MTDVETEARVLAALLGVTIENYGEIPWFIMTWPSGRLEVIQAGDWSLARFFLRNTTSPLTYRGAEA